MDQSPAAFFYKADATDNGYRGATGFRGFGDFSVDVLLLTGAGGGGENLLPTCVLCHVSRCTGSLPSGWVVLSQTLERYYEPRGLLPRPTWTSVALIPRRCRRPPASEEISRPGVIRLSQRAIANTPVL